MRANDSTTHNLNYVAEHIINKPNKLEIAAFHADNKNPRIA